MALNWTVEQFNSFIDGILPDNQARMISEADLREALKNTVLRNDERATTSEMYAAGLNTSFISRSLSLTATIYVDGVNGNDIRTGLTADNNAVWGAVKTIDRAVALHSQKTQNLTIIISGNTQVNSYIDLDVPFVTFMINQNVTLTFNKKSIEDANGIVVGEGTWPIFFYGHELNFYNQGTIQVQAHTGSTGLGDQYYYRQRQGAISMSRRYMLDSERFSTLNVAGIGVLNVGNNTIFAHSGASGTNSDGINRLARYRRSGVIGGSLILGTNAIESVFTGDHTVIRRYTPSSSTDMKVDEHELVGDSSFLYSKRDGVIKKIAWTTF